MKIMNTAGSGGQFNYNRPLTIIKETNFKTTNITSPETHIIDIDGDLIFLQMLISTSQENKDYEAHFYIDDFEYFKMSSKDKASGQITIGCVPLSVSFMSDYNFNGASCLGGDVFGNAYGSYPTILNFLEEKKTRDIIWETGARLNEFVEMNPVKVNKLKIVITKSNVTSGYNLFRINQIKYFKN